MYQADIPAAIDFLQSVLSRQVTDKASTWITAQLSRFPEDQWGRSFHLAFSAAPRFVGKEPLEVTESEKKAAEALRTGLRPDSWSRDQACRILFLLSLPHSSAEVHGRHIHEVFDTADMGELTAIYAALPLLPFPEQYASLAAEGVRTNMTVVFDAVALNNPYPAQYLDENGWNQLFLKSAFTGRPMYQIQGVAERANAELARIVSDYAHERWAAKREVSPEIWRPVAPFINETLLEDMRRLFDHPMQVQQAAAALVCAASSDESARKLLASRQEWAQAIGQNKWSWEKVGKRWAEEAVVSK